MSCASDELLAAWAAGQVGGAERDGLEEHASGCALCRGVMLGLVGVTRTVGETGEPPKPGQRIRATDDTIRQAQALTQIKHASVQRVTAVDVDGDDLVLTTEPVVGVTLGEWLERPRTQRDRAKMLAQVGRGLNVLHAHQITHGAITKDHVVVLRGGVGAVLIRPAFGSTPKEDQAAWWRLVVETIGRPRMLRRAIAKGLSEGYSSMDNAVMKLRNRAGDRAHMRWVMPVVVVAAAIGAITAATPKHKSLTDVGNTSKCAATATNEWRALRIPVIGKLASSGADTPRVIQMLDDRTQRTAVLQRQTCSGAERMCVDAVWSEHTALYGEMLGDHTRMAVDELMTLPPPDRCLHDMAAPAVSAARAEIWHIALDQQLAPSDQVQRLVALKPNIDEVAALWHYELGRAYMRGDDAANGASELESAANAAKLSGDIETFVRALTAQIALTDEPDATLEHRAEAAARTLDNKALNADLAYSEAGVRNVAGDTDGAIAKLRDAKREWDKVAIDAHVGLVDTSWLLGHELEESGDSDYAAKEYDVALVLARKRWGDAFRDTLLIRQARASNEVDRGHYDVARRELRATEAGFDRLYGENEEVADVRRNLCECDIAAGTVTGSCEGALESAERVYGDHDVQLIPSLDLVGREHTRAKDYDAAIATFERALALDTPDEHPITEADLAIALHRAHRLPARVKTLAASVRAGLAEDAPARKGLEAELKQ